MKYELADRIIDIPDQDIENLKHSLNLNTTQAISLWLFDNDIDDSNSNNEENKKSITKNNARTQIMQWVFAALQDKVDNAELRASNKTLSFSLGPDRYELSLTKKRK